MAPPLLLVRMELHLSADQPGTKDIKSSLTKTFYLLKPHHMNVELLLQPPLLIDHVGTKVSEAFLLLIFTAVPPAKFSIIVT